MSKVVLRKDNMLRVFELPSFIESANSTELDFNAANKLLELPCEFYEVIENKYVFFKSEGKYYIYGLNGHEENPVELSVQEPGVGNKLKLISYNEEPYVCEIDKKGNIIKVYIVLNDCFFFSAMPCTSLQFDLKNDITYLCEIFEDGTMKGVFDTKYQKFISCSYDNHLSFVKSINKDFYYIAESNESKKVITFYVNDFSGEYEKISTRTTNSFLKFFYIGKAEYIIEVLYGKTISIYNTYNGFQIFVSGINEGKLEFFGKEFVFEFDNNDNIINIYNILLIFNLKTRINSIFMYNNYNKENIFIEKDLYGVASIYIEPGTQVIASLGNHLKYYVNNGKLVIKEFNKNGRKVTKCVID